MFIGYLGFDTFRLIGRTVGFAFLWHSDTWKITNYLSRENEEKGERSRVQLNWWLVVKIGKSDGFLFSYNSLGWWAGGNRALDKPAILQTGSVL